MFSASGTVSCHFVMATMRLPWTFWTLFIPLSAFQTIWRSPVRQNLSPLHYFQVTSALESDDLEWKSLEEFSHDVNATDLTDDLDEVALYPVPAVYLPHSGSHTFVNTKAHTIALSLNETEFCAVLRVKDTGRMATVGTMMEIVSTKMDKNPYGEIVRITMECNALEAVNLASICNPQSAEWLPRFHKSTEYLRARVCSRPDIPMAPVPSDVQEDYATVRDQYLAGLANEDIPYDSLVGFADLPHILANYTQATDLWQSICHTVCTGHDINLACRRNEFLCQNAFRPGQIRNLPVYPDDLNATAQQELKRIEQQAQTDWLAIDMDPVVDFQRLLERPSWKQLGRMMRRERERLEIKEWKPPPMEKEEEDPVQRKGAWFDDACWE